MAEVELDRQDGVAVITLNAPTRRNALTVESALALIEIVEEVNRDTAIGSAILRASGDAFCAGADLALLRGAGAQPHTPESFSSLSTIYEAFLSVGRLKVPTIAVVHGSAVGAGLNLALATHVRLVTEATRLISGFARIGLHPGGGHFALLARAASRDAVAASALFSAEISGRRAVELGLAWALLEPEDIDAYAHDLARAAAADPALSRQMVQVFEIELGPPALPWSAAVHAERASQIWSFGRAGVPSR